MQEDWNEFFKKNSDRTLSADDIAKGLEIPVGRVEEMLAREFEKNEELFVIGNDNFIFTKDRDLVAFEIMKEVAPNITKEEWSKHRQDLPRLMYLSRRREIGKYDKNARSIMELTEG